MNRKKINLYQKVTTLEEYESLVKRNIYPLVVVLDEIEREILEELKKDPDSMKKSRIRVLKSLQENYQEEENSNYENEFYMKLDTVHLQKRVCKGQIILKKLFTYQNEVQYINSFFISDLPEKYVKIGFQPRKSLRESISCEENQTCSIVDLTKKAIEQYQRGCKKKYITHAK